MKTDEGRRNAAVVLSLVFILFSIYGLTTPKTVPLEDDGLFIMASLDGGVAHPPGYPLFTFLGHLFSYLLLFNGHQYTHTFFLMLMNLETEEMSMFLKWELK